MRKTISGMLTVVLCVLAFDASARFVSIDPVQANPNNGQNFNRYWYGNNNPYKFTDPDGRAVQYAIGGTVTEAQLRAYLIGIGFSPTGRAELQQLELSNSTYTIQLDSRAENWFDQSDLTIYINPDSFTKIKSSGEMLDPKLIGIHEISHGAEYDRIGADAFNEAMQPVLTTTTDASGNTVVIESTSPEEARATTVEQAAGGELGLPIRQDRNDVVCRPGVTEC